MSNDKDIDVEIKSKLKSIIKGILIIFVLIFAIYLLDRYSVQFSKLFNNIFSFQHWEMYSSKDGKFSAAFPKKPYPKTRINELHKTIFLVSLIKIEPVEAISVQSYDLTPHELKKKTILEDPIAYDWLEHGVISLINGKHFLLLGTRASQVNYTQMFQNRLVYRSRTSVIKNNKQYLIDVTVSGLGDLTYYTQKVIESFRVIE